MTGNPHNPGTRIIGRPRRACRVPGMYGVTAGEAKRARLCGQRTICSCPPFRTISIPNLFDSESRTWNRPRRFMDSGMLVATSGTARCAILRGQRTAWIRPHLHPTFVLIPNLFDSESRIEECPRRACRVPGMYDLTEGVAWCAFLCGRRTIRPRPPFFISIGGAYRWATISSDRGSPPSSTPACPRKDRRNQAYPSTPNSRRAVRGAGRTVLKL